LNLKEKGVIITAILKNAPGKIGNFIATIAEANPKGFPEIYVSTTNEIENKVVFHAIPTEFDELHVSITGDNIPMCHSEIFNTTDDENKEVIIEIPEKAKLKGTVLWSTGLPVTGTFYATVISASKSNNARGMLFFYQKPIQPDFTGRYEIPFLTPGLFKFTFMYPELKKVKTSLHIDSPETTFNFSFNKLSTLPFTGIVVHEADNEPIERIIVKAVGGGGDQSYVSCVTDKDGKFSLELKEDYSGGFGDIVVDEPGFAKVRKQMNKRNKYIKIILSQCGNVKGKVITKSGKPITHETVRMRIIEKGNPGTTKKINISSDERVSYRTKTDENGNYEFLNVVAPAKYGFEIDGHISGYKLPSYYTDKGFTVEVEVGKTAECDLIGIQNATIAVKGQDLNGKSVLKYDLSYKIQNGSYHVNPRHVDVSADEWFYFDLLSVGKNVFSCSAKENSKSINSLVALTNNIPVYDSTTNYITLIFSKLEPDLTGFLFNPDGSPAKFARIRIWKSGKGYANTSIDNSGYFELYGLKVKKGEMMNVEANSFSTKMHIYTNLPSGSKNVKLRLNLPYTVTGKVFLDNLDTPAENFVVSLGYEKQSYHSQDGSFVFAIKQTRNNIKKGSVTISVENYLPGFGNYNFTDKNTCDVGNIILKSGETAKIHGRVVNQNDKPIDIRVGLWCSAAEKSFTAFSSSKDGSYAFDGVPPGMAKVSVQSRLGFKDSHEFEVKEGEDLELPDLVINYTNSASVTLTFKLPNGDLVTDTRIANKSFYIRQDGKLRRAMRAGIYSDWKIKYNGKNYIAK
jgi:hypothetical protein